MGQAEPVKLRQLQSSEAPTPSISSPQPEKKEGNEQSESLPVQSDSVVISLKDRAERKSPVTELAEKADSRNSGSGDKQQVLNASVFSGRGPEVKSVAPPTVMYQVMEDTPSPGSRIEEPVVGGGKSSQPEKEPQTEQEKQDLQERLRERIHIIESIGRGLSGDFKLTIQEGPGWAYDFKTNTIMYKKEDLMNKSEDYGLGVILHETGHRRYSRWVRDPDLEQNPAMALLSNGVEDPRINNLMISRYAGSKPFFRAIYDEEFLKKTEADYRKDMIDQMTKQMGMPRDKAEKAVARMKEVIPRHMQYILALIYDWYTEGQRPSWLKNKEVIAALDKTQKDYREAYQLRRDIFFDDLTPKEIFEQADETYKIVKEKLWPEYKKLIDEDKKDLAKGMAGLGSPRSGQGSGKPQQGQGSGQGQPQPSSGGGSGQPNQANDKKNQQGGSGQGGGADKNQQAKDQKGGGGAGKADEKEKKEAKDQKGGGGSDKADEKKEKDKAQGGGDGKDKADEKKDKTQGAGDGDEKADEKKEGGQPQPEPTEEDEKNAEKVLEGMEKDMNKKLESKEQQSQQDPQNSSGGQGQGGSSNSRGTTDIQLPTLQELYEKQKQLEKQLESLKTPYEKYSTELAPIIDEMAGELKNILEENSSPKFVGDFPSGKRINLRKAMQAQGKYEVTGEFDPDIWLRRDLPSQRDYDFVFVLDESGSMIDAEKWSNAMKALILSAEALEQLKIKFGVVGFSDYPKVHKKMDDRYDEGFRERMLGDILRSPHQNTNDSDAVKIALDMVKETPPDKIKIIVVISDGQGKERELQRVIQQADKDGVKVIGVGIGEGMYYVKKVYPQNVVVSDVKDLPFAMANLIQEEIIGGVDQVV